MSVVNAMSLVYYFFGTRTVYVNPKTAVIKTILNNETHPSHISVLTKVYAQNKVGQTCYSIKLNAVVITDINVQTLFFAFLSLFGLTKCRTTSFY